MNPGLRQKIDSTLRGYVVHVETLDPECDDTFIMLNAREWLESQLSVLTDTECQVLAAADAQLVRLARTVTVETLDVEYLRQTLTVVAASQLTRRSEEHRR